MPRRAGADADLPAAAPENSLPGDALPEAGGDPSLPTAPPADSLPAEVPSAPPTPQALALLANKNVVLDAPGVAEINAGRVDPRVVGVLTQLSQEHKITVSALKSADGGMDIAAVDGEMVNPDSGAARDLASALAELPPGLRPDSVGSPWAIAAPGFFTDGAHQDHLSVAFKRRRPAAAGGARGGARPGGGRSRRGAGGGRGGSAGARRAGRAGVRPDEVRRVPPGGQGPGRGRVG